MRVLYVNHTARVSGAERSLLELMAALHGQVDLMLACPEGDLSRRAEAAGLPTVRLPSFEIGWGSGTRELLRAGASLVRIAARVASLSRRLEVDIVHAASTRSGIVAGVAALIGGRRPVVDVRDSLPAGVRGGFVRWALRILARTLVFNSQFTLLRFGATGPADAVVAYPPVNVARFAANPIRRKPPLAPLTIGMIGQITPWKGHDDAIRMLALLRPRFPLLRLRIVGSVVFAGPNVTFDNDSFRQQLLGLTNELGVSDAVEFTDATEDLESVFASLDVVLVPSWEEPFGRVVAEAMAAGAAVVATIRGGPAELIADGVNGYLVEPRQPEAWVEPLSLLLADAKLRGRIGRQARQHVVSEFDRGKTLEQMVRLYRNTATASRSSELAIEAPGRSAS